MQNSSLLASLHFDANSVGFFFPLPCWPCHGSMFCDVCTYNLCSFLVGSTTTLLHLCLLSVSIFGVLLALLQTHARRRRTKFSHRPTRVSCGPQRAGDHSCERPSPDKTSCTALVSRRQTLFVVRLPSPFTSNPCKEAPNQVLPQAHTRFLRPTACW